MAAILINLNVRICIFRICTSCVYIMTSAFGDKYIFHSDKSFSRQVQSADIVSVNEIWSSWPIQKKISRRIWHCHGGPKHVPTFSQHLMWFSINNRQRSFFKWHLKTYHKGATQRRDEATRQQELHAPSKGQEWHTHTHTQNLKVVFKYWFVK